MKCTTKGAESRHRSLENVPLVAMSRAELEEAFDEIGQDETAEMLNEARTNKEPMVIAALILRRPGQPDGLVTYTAEYGDGEGERSINEEMACIRRLKLLLPGETMEHRQYSVKWPELTPIQD